MKFKKMEQFNAHHNALMILSGVCKCKNKIEIPKENTGILDYEDVVFTITEYSYGEKIDIHYYYPSINDITMLQEEAKKRGCSHLVFSNNNYLVLKGAVESAELANNFIDSEPCGRFNMFVVSVDGEFPQQRKQSSLVNCLPKEIEVY